MYGVMLVYHLVDHKYKPLGASLPAISSFPICVFAYASE